MTDAFFREDRRIREFCPVHSPERGSCWDGCLPERVELARLAANLRQYWYVRRRGVPSWTQRWARTKGVA